MADKEQVHPSDAPERINRAIASEVPQIYANGFVNSISSGDIVTVLERNGKPVALLNLSYTVAKTLARSLAQIFAQMEELTGREMLTTHEVQGALQRNQDKGKEPTQ